MKILALFLLPSILPALAPQQEEAPVAKPNVLFIAIDDLNDWIGPLAGHPQSKTPNLERLARRGVLFTNAHCAAPACNPSRAALMTGIPPYRSGVYLNSQPWRPALEKAVTIPQHFMAHGYTARGSGKIFHGSFPDPESWDEYFPSKRKQKPNDPMPKQRPVNGIPKTAHFDWGPLDVVDEEMGDAKVAEWVVGQLRKKHDKPFFLACGFYRPHLPWYVPRKYFEQFPAGDVVLPKIKEGDLEDIPAAGVAMAKPGGDHFKVIEHGQWKQAVQGYLASIAFTDSMLGRVLDALDESEHAANTIVVLWTDHGWHLGEKQHWRKFTLWEEATRTPLMFVVPKGVPGLTAGTKAGQRCSRAVSLMDIYPTLVELCGLTPRKDLSGSSLVPLLRNPNAPWEGVALTTHERLNHSVRSERWRYIRYRDGSEELYDHDNDPNEWANLAGDPDFALQKQKLAEWLPEKNAPNASRRKGKRR